MHSTNIHVVLGFNSLLFKLIYFEMRYRQLFLVIVGWVFVLGNGIIQHVSGMPLHLSGVGGSERCDFHFLRPTMEQPRWRVSYEIVFGDKSSLDANNRSCDIDIWTDRTKIDQEDKTQWREVDLTQPIISRELRKLEVQLETENPELYKVNIKETHFHFNALRTKHPLHLSF